jgi:chromosome partitioning protein
MKTLAICNHKGGAGKTTTAYYLGLLLASGGLRTLLIDLDPQHNLTSRFMETPATCTIADVLGQQVSLGECTHAVEGVSDLFLCPSEFQLANVAYGLINDVVRGRSALQRALRGVDGRFDVVLIDCPPEAGILLVNALLAADAVLLPGEPEEAALAGIRKCAEMIDQIRTEFGRETPIVLGSVAARVDLRTNRHQDGLALMGRSRLAPLLATIPERNGQGREADLLVSYSTLAGHVLGWLEGAAHA